MNRVTFICGPTAVGKSAVAIKRAQLSGAEIVSADSQQVYRGCDIGTGKVARAERNVVPHHLIDICDPNEAYDAYRFVQEARAAIADIHARGKAAIVVGGTGLYLKSLQWGLCDTPPRDVAVRAQLDARVQAEGAPALHAELEAQDPELAAQIHPNHSSRIVRALEVQQLTGKSIRSFQEVHRCSEAQYPDAEWVGLECPREQLRERIAKRVRGQLAAGWFDEVRQLYEQYGADISIFRAIGYRELLTCHLQSETPESAYDAIVTATAQYAKRQMTYFRSLDDIQWQQQTRL